MKELLTGLLLMMVFVSGCFRSADDCMVRDHYGRGKIENLTAEELKLETVLKETAILPAAVAYGRGMFDAAYIIAEEHENLGFTVYFKESTVVVERGLNKSIEPTIVIPLSDEAIYNTLAFFKDGVLDEREEFLIINAVFKPGWEASYRIPGIRNFFVRKYMNLDTIIHATLLNPKGYEYKNKVVRNELSIVPAKSQWLVFSGLEGIPDIRMEMSMQDAKAMYRLIVCDLKKADSWSGKKAVLQKFDEVRNRCIVKK